MKSKIYTMDAELFDSLIQKEFFEPKQLHQIDLKELQVSNPIVFEKLVCWGFFNFSFNQLFALSEISNEILHKLPKDLINIIQIIDDVENSYSYLSYCLNADTNPLKKEVIEKMPDLFKIIYLNNYIEKISIDQRCLFKSSIDFIFQNPKLFCSNIFSIFLNEWDQKDIFLYVLHINIDQFPKEFLYDLITRFENTDDLLMKLSINDILVINDEYQRFFVFKRFVNNSISLNLVNSIDVQNLNQQETIFLIDSCSSLLSNDQIKNIKLNFLQFNQQILFINDSSKKLTEKQIKTLDFQESEIAKIIINHGYLPKCDDNQLKLINIGLIGKTEAKKFITFLYENDKLEILCPAQVQQINFNSIDDNIQFKLISIFVNEMTNTQIQCISFSLPDKIEEILKILSVNNKLHLLKLKNVKQVNIFLLNDINLIRSILSIPLFAKYFANNIFHISSDEFFKKVDYKMIEYGFLQEIIEALAQEIDEEQSKQIKIKKLEQQIIEILLKLPKIIISDEEIKAIKLQSLHPIQLNNLIQKKYAILLPNQINDVKIDKLTHDSQIILLAYRRNNLSNEQFVKFDATNVSIAKLLISYAFDKISIEQINSISISQLDFTEQSKILQYENKYFYQLNENIIQKVDLSYIKKHDLKVYYDLIKFKSNYLSIDQFMEIDWLDDIFHHPSIDLSAQIFIEHCTNDENKINKKQYLNFLFDKDSISPEKITPYFQNIYHIPDEVIVSITNSRIIHNLFTLVPTNIKCYIPAIKHMFEHPDDFLVSIQYIIDNWSQKHKRAISKLINNLKICQFSNEITISLLNHYLFFIPKGLLQSFDLSKVPLNVIQKILLNRPLDFLPSQITKIEFPNSFQIRKFLQLLETKNLDEFYKSIDLTIESLNLIDFNQLDVQCLNCMFRYQSKNIPKEIVQKCISPNTLNKIDKDDFIIFLNDHVNNLSNIQIKQIKLGRLDITAKLIMNRIHDFSVSQIIDISNTDFDVVDQFIHQIDFDKDIFSILRESHLFKFLPEFYFKSDILFNDSENLEEVLRENLQEKIMLNNKYKIIEKTFSKLQTDIQIRFLHNYHDNLPNSLFHILDTNKKMAKFLINHNLLKKLSIKQIQSFDLFEFDNDMLIKLVKSSSITNLSDEQIESDCITNILYLLNPIDLQGTVFKLCNKFKINQIQAIKVNDPEIARYLLKKRPKDLSLDQIQAIKVNDPEIAGYLLKERPKDLSLDQIQSLRTENEIIAHLINECCLYHNLTDEQKNKFNKNELLRCSDNQLIYILNAPCKIKIDTIITGLLIYKYFNENNCSYQLKIIMRNIIQVYRSDIILAKFILILENEFSDLNRFQFSSISKKFFKKMNQYNLNIFNKLKRNQQINLAIGNILSISQNDFVKIICEKLNQMSVNDAQKILEPRCQTFLGKFHKYIDQYLFQNPKKLWEKLGIRYDSIEKKYKVISSNTNSSQNQPQEFINRYFEFFRA